MSAIPRSFTILATNSSAADPFTAVSFKASGGIFYGANSQTITGDANGAWAVAANGTNQSITLTPSGTGLALVSKSSSGPALLLGATAPATDIGTGIVFNSTNVRKGWAIGYNLYNIVGGLEFMQATANGGTTFSSTKMALSTNGNLLLGGLTTDGTGVLQLPNHTSAAGGIALGTGVSLFTTSSGGNSVRIAASSGSTVELNFNDFGANSLKIGSSSGVAYVTNVANAAMTLGVNNTDVISFTSSTNVRVIGTKTLQFGATSAATIGVSADTTAGVLTFTAPSAGSFALTGGKVSSYNSIATAGWGFSTVQADGAIAATTNARSAAVATYTVGAADGTFIVSANVNVTTSTGHSFSVDCVYTDETNTSRTLVMPMAQLAGSFVATGLITNVTGAGPYESASMTIRCKTNTSITIRPSVGGTYTNVVYNTAANIRQVG